MKNYLSSLVTCEVWLVHQRGFSAEGRADLINKSVPGWRPAEGKQTANLAPGTFQPHSTTPCAQSSGCAPWLGQEKASLQKIWHCPWNTRWSDSGDHYRSSFLTLPLYVPRASRETQMARDRPNCCPSCSLEESEMHTYALLATHTRTKQTNWISFGFHLKPSISSTFLHVDPTVLDTFVFVMDFRSPEIKFSLWFPASCSYDTQNWWGQNIFMIILTNKLYSRF